MRIIIKETGEERSLEYRDANGINWAADFVGNSNGINEIDGDGRVVMSSSDYTWWANTIQAHQRMDDELGEYRERYGSTAVQSFLDATHAAADCDLEDIPSSVHRALEQWFIEPSAAAAVLGRKGGRATSPRKAVSSAANGRKGGRPPGVKLDDETAAMIANPELMAALAAQDERLAAVVTAVHVDGATLADVAARFGISRERARQLRAQGLRRLRGIAK
jgi:hypothetical protein